MNAHRRGWQKTAVHLLVVALVATTSTLISTSVASAQAAPTAGDDVVSIGPGGSVVIDVLDNDAGGQPLDVLTIISVPEPPTTGVATITDRGTTITYDAPVDFAGTSFSYEVEDSRGGTAGAQVTVNAACTDIAVAASGGAAALNGAIVAANACPGHQTITVEPGTYAQRTSFTSITDDLSIIGDVTSRPVIRIDITGTYATTFAVRAGATVQFENLVFDDPGAFSTFVSVDDASVIVRNVQMNGSIPARSEGAVAAVWARASNVEIENSEIHNSDSSAITGFDGTHVIASDTAITGSSGYGLAVETLEATRLEISGGGGGISVSGPATIDDSFIWNNSGTALRQTVRTTTTVTNTVIGRDPDGNRGPNGIGMAVFGRLDVTNSIVANSMNEGIGAYAGFLAPVSLIDVQVLDNGTTGVILSAPTIADLTRVTISGNGGDGLYLQDRPATVTDSTITSNGTDCSLFRSALVDAGGNTDSDGSCGFVVPNDPPVAVDDAAGLGPNQTITIDVLANDTDPDGDELTIVSTTSPNATVASDAKTISYAAPSTFGGETFTYTIVDDQSETSTATVRVSLECGDITVAGAEGGAGFTSAVVQTELCPGPQTIFVEGGTYILDAGFRISDELAVVAADPAARPRLTLRTGPTGTGYLFYVDAAAGPFVLNDIDVEATAPWALAFVRGVNAGFEAVHVSPIGLPLDCSVGVPSAMYVEAAVVTVARSLLEQPSCNGIEAADDANLLLTEVAIAGAPGDGISTSGQLTLVDSYIYDNGRNGIGNSTGQAASLEITGSFLYGNGGDGVSTVGGSLTVASSAFGTYGSAGEVIAAGNIGAGIRATFTDIDLANVVVANNGTGLRVADNGTATTAVAASFFYDNSVAGVHIGNSSSIALAGTELRTNGANCLFDVRATLVDDGGNADDDGTCGTNHPPEATADRAAIQEDTPLVLATPGVLINDGDLDGDPITAELVSGPAHAQSFDLRPDGGVAYVPEKDFYGDDSITYRVSDGVLFSQETTLEIRVLAVNDAPVIEAPNEIEVEQNQAIPLGVSVTDVDAEDVAPFEADDVVLLVGLSADHGAVTVDPTAGVTITPTPNGALAIEGEPAAINVALATAAYTPDLDYVGPDTIEIVAEDRGENGSGGNLTNTASIAVEVTEANNPPVAADERYEIDEDRTLTVNSPGVLNNDIEPDGDTMTAQLVVSPTDGSLVLRPNGSFTYTPPPDFSGDVFFTYFADDGRASSNDARVTITVNPINDEPDIVLTPNPLIFDEDDEGSITAAVSDVDGPADDIVVTAALLDPTLGTVNVTGVGATRTITIVGAADTSGETTLQVGVSDGENAALHFVPVTIVAVNDAPTIAAIDDQSIDEDASTVIQVAIGDLETATALLAVSATTEPAGIVTVTPSDQDPGLTITGEPNSFGETVVTVAVSDGTDTTLTTFVVTVRPINDAPVGVPDSYTTPEGVTIKIDSLAESVIANDSDIDGDELAVLSYTDPSHGSFVGLPDGTFSYEPDAGFNGDDEFRYILSDGQASTTPILVSITVEAVDDPPVGIADAFVVDEDEELVVPAPGVLFNDTDPDTPAEELIATVAAAPPVGTLSLTADGGVSYVPPPNFFGDVSFSYTVTDAASTSDPVTVTVEVQPVNDAPVILAPGSSETGQGAPIEFGIGVTDIDSDDVEVAAQVVPTWSGDVALSAPDANGTIIASFVPAADFFGVASIVITADDGDRTGSATTAVTVAPAPQPSDGLVDLTVIWIPLGPNDETFEPATGYAIDFDDNGNRIAIDIRDHTPGGCLGGDNVCAAIIDLPPSTRGYTLTIVDPDGTWATSYAGDCAAVDDRGVQRFVVVSGAIQTCDITHTEVGFEVTATQQPLRLQQIWNPGPAVGDAADTGVADIEINGQNLDDELFENCGNPLFGGGSHAGECTEMLSYNPLFPPHISLAPATDWITAITGACEPSTTNNPDPERLQIDITPPPATIPTCTLTHTWIGSPVGSTDGLLDLTVIWNSPQPDWTDPGGDLITFANPDTQTTIDIAAAANAVNCPTTSTGLPSSTCAATITLPATDAYQIEPVTLDPNWTTTFTGDCEIPHDHPTAPAGETPRPWFPINQAQHHTCTITYTEIGYPTTATEQPLRLQQIWNPGPAVGDAAGLGVADIEINGQNLDDELFENCGNPLFGGGSHAGECTEMLSYNPLFPPHISLAPATDWITAITGACEPSTTNNPDPERLQIDITPPPATIPTCTLTHTWIGSPVGSTDGLLDLTVIWNSPQPDWTDPGGDLITFANPDTQTTIDIAAAANAVNCPTTSTGLPSSTCAATITLPATDAYQIEPVTLDPNWTTTFTGDCEIPHDHPTAPAGETPRPWFPINQAQHHTCTITYTEVGYPTTATEQPLRLQQIWNPGPAGSGVASIEVGLQPIDDELFEHCGNPSADGGAYSGECTEMLSYNPLFRPQVTVVPAVGWASTVSGACSAAPSQPGLLTLTITSAQGAIPLCTITHTQTSTIVALSLGDGEPFAVVWPGDTLDLRAAGFAPGSPVSVFLGDLPIAEVSASTNGVVSTMIGPIPDLDPGTYVLSVRGTNLSGNVARAETEIEVEERPEVELRIRPTFFVEDDPGAGPITPVAVGLQGSEDVEVAVMVTAGPPSFGDTPEFDDFCSPAQNNTVDVVFGPPGHNPTDSLLVTLEPGTNFLPITFCHDHVPEPQQRLRIEVFDPATDELLDSRDVFINDDDLVTINGPRALVEGGLIDQINGVDLAVPLIDTVAHDFEFDVPPWVAPGSFRLAGIPYGVGTSCSSLFFPPPDLVLIDSWQNGKGTISTCGDSLIEPDRSAELVFDSASGSDRFPLTFVDDDRPPVFAAGQSATVIEPAPGESPASRTVTVRLTESSAFDYQVRVTTLPVAGGAAISTGEACDGDVAFSDDLVIIPANATSFEVALTVCPDLIDDSDGVVSVSFSAPSILPLPAPLAVMPVTIEDNLVLPQIDVDAAEAFEGDDFVTVDFDVTTPSLGLLWARTRDGSARDGEDYRSIGGLLTPLALDLDPLETGRASVDIALVDDDIAEDPERFTLEIWTDPLGGVRVATATITILDNDTPPVIDLADIEIAEGTGIIDISFPDGPTGYTTTPGQLTITEPPLRPYQLHFETSAPGDTATPGPCDPTQLSGTFDYRTNNSTTTITVVPGPANQTITIDDLARICADLAVETNETFTITILDEHNNPLDTATVTILNDDQPPQLTINDLTINEHDTNPTITINVDTPAYTPLYVQLNNNTAIGGPFTGDYTRPLNRLILPTIPGRTGPVTHNLTINDDPDIEPTETFTLEIWDLPTNGNKLATATITILDNDTPPVIDLADIEIAEGTGIIDISFPDGPTGYTTTPGQLTITEPPLRPYQLHFETSAPGDTATPGPCDPTQLSGTFDYRTNNSTTTITVVPGPANQTITIDDLARICADLAVETNETFTITILDEHNNPLDTATVTILNDDQPPQLTINDLTINEHDTNPTITINVDTPAYTPLYVQLNNNTAIGGPFTGDYTRPLNRLILPTIPGRTGPVTHNLTINDDPDIEPTETFTIEIWDLPTNGNKLATATITILDNDTPPVITGIAQAVDEPSDAFAPSPEIAVVFEIDEPGAPITLWPRAREITASSNDYASLELAPIFLARDSADPIPVKLTIVNDAVPEVDETLDIELWDSPLFGTRVAAARVTIADDDNDYPLFAAPDAVTITEDGDGADLVFTIVEPASKHADIDIRWRPASSGSTAGTCPLFGTGADLGGGFRTRTVNPVSTELVVRVGGCADLVLESDRAIEVVLTTPDGDELASTTVTILDDDDPPVLEVLDVTIDEGDPYGSFFNPMYTTSGTVELRVVDVPERPYHVVLRPTAAGTASRGISCTPFPGFAQPDVALPSTLASVTVSPDDAGRVFTFERSLACANTDPEADSWYEIEVADGPGESGGVSHEARVTILDDDAYGASVSISDGEVIEGDSGQTTVELLVTVSGQLVAPVHVDWSASEVDAGSILRPATGFIQLTPGVDFKRMTGELSFPVAGTQVISIPVQNDTLAEGDEWFEVTLTSVDNAEATDAVGFARIIDNDGNRVSAIDAADVIEGPSGETRLMTFAVELSNPPTTSTSVRWSTHASGGVVAPDDTNLASPAFADDPDFVQASGTLVFHPGGALRQTVSVTVLGDDIDEFDETIYFFIEPTGAVISRPIIGDGVAIGRIIDDDLLPSRDLDPPAIVYVKSIEASLPLGQATVPVTFQVKAADARDGAVDVVCTPASGFAFPAGTTTVTCTSSDSSGNTASIDFEVNVEGRGATLTDAAGRATGSASPGQTISATARGFGPGTTVRAILRSEPRLLAALRADDSGTAGGRLVLPADVPLGRHTLVFQGVDASGNSREAQIPIEIQAATIVNVTTSPPATVAGSNGADAVQVAVDQSGAATTTLDRGPVPQPPLAHTGTAGRSLTMLGLSLLGAGALGVGSSRVRRRGR